MANVELIRTNVEKFLGQFGNDVRLKYYLSTHDATDYDNAALYTSGNFIWVKAYQQPINYKKGGAEQKLVAAGKLQMNDSKLYIAGSLATDMDVWTKIGIGSPDMSQYAPIEEGIYLYKIGSTPIYRMSYIRHLNRGTFINEFEGEADLEEYSEGTLGPINLGSRDIRTKGRFINDVATKGWAQVANNGNYYETTTQVIDGEVVKVYSSGLGSPI